jgi:hypothetical protein
MNNILSLLFITALNLLTLSSVESVERQYLRIVRFHAKNIFLNCPISTANEKIVSENLFWINENNLYDKSDENIIVSQSNTIQKGQTFLQVNETFVFVSCGFISSNVYHRIKVWNLIFVGNQLLMKNISDLRKEK